MQDVFEVQDIKVQRVCVGESQVCFVALIERSLVYIYWTTDKKNKAAKQAKLSNFKWFYISSTWSEAFPFRPGTNL